MAVWSHITDILKLLQMFLCKFKVVFLLLIMPFKMRKIRYFFQKKNIKNICLPTLPKISDLIPVTLIFFYFA